MTFRKPYITPGKTPAGNRSIDATVPTNVLIFTNPIPFVSTDRPQTKTRAPLGGPPQSLPVNVNLFTNPIPFVTTDRPRIIQVPLVPPPQSLPLNINLYTNPIPVNNSRLLIGASKVKYVLPDSTDPSEMWLFPVTVTAPFYTQDFSTSKTLPNWFTSPTYPNLAIINTQPFNNSILLIGGKSLATVSDATDASEMWLLQVPAPFSQQNWAKPWTQPASLSDQTVLIIFPEAPLVPVDLSSSTRLPSSSVLQYPNIALLNPVVVQFPFYTQDFSRPFTPVPAKPDQQALNLNLYTNPIPFLSYDWSKPLDIKASIDPQYPNLILLQPVAPPFYQLDWSKAYTIRPKASNQNEVPNLLLIQPSIPSRPLGISSWLNVGYVKSPIIIVADQNNLPNIVLPNTVPVPPVIFIPGGKTVWIPRWGEKHRRQYGDEEVLNEIKKAAAVLSSLGGHARAKSLTSKQRSNIASTAAKARWK